MDTQFNRVEQWRRRSAYRTHVYIGGPVLALNIASLIVWPAMRRSVTLWLMTAVVAIVYVVVLRRVRRERAEIGSPSSEPRSAPRAAS